MGFASLSDRLEDSAAVAGPVKRELVEAACAYADRVSHGQTLGDKSRKEKDQWGCRRQECQ